MTVEAKSDTGRVKRKLARYMRAQVAWRVACASWDPARAPGHRRSADAIEAWAQYVEALPDDDPNLAAIAAGQALIGSPPDFRPRSDGGAMIRRLGYPKTIGSDERTGALGSSPELATPAPPPNKTLMSELAALEGPPGPSEEVAHIG
jgi:hypothetical protein